MSFASDKAAALTVLQDTRTLITAAHKQFKDIGSNALWIALSNDTAHAPWLQSGVCANWTVAQNELFKLQGYALAQAQYDAAVAAAGQADGFPIGR
jgi:hypothetical protein